jgi:hypothetical protein
LQTWIGSERIGEGGTYIFLGFDDCLHKEDRGRRKLGQERSAVLDKEVMHLSFAPESLLEVLDAYVRECGGLLLGRECR